MNRRPRETPKSSLLRVLRASVVKFLPCCADARLANASRDIAAAKQIDPNIANKFRDYGLSGP
jgi:hypothetical protein